MERCASTRSTTDRSSAARTLKVEQTLKNIPTGQWAHLEAYLRQSPGTTGIFRLWQDGTRIINLQNIQTRYVNGDQQWSVNNYSSGLMPAVAALWYDNAAIATARQGP